MVIKTEIIEIADKYGDDRRTAIGYDEEELEDEDLIPDTEAVVTFTKLGYIKRMSIDNFKVQGRGGKGIRGIQTIENDYVVDMLQTTTHHDILFFTNKGRVYKLKVYKVPEASRTARGTAVVNLINLQPDEVITSMIPMKDYGEDEYLFMATYNGIAKKTKLSEYANINKNGLIAINLRDDDLLIEVKKAHDTDEAMLFTREGFLWCHRHEPGAGRPCYRHAADFPGKCGHDRLRKRLRQVHPDLGIPAPQQGRQGRQVLQDHGKDGFRCRRKGRQ